MQFFLLLLFFSFATEASVQDICSLAQPRVPTVTNLDELGDSICAVRDSSNDQEITRLSQHSLQILGGLRSSATEESLNDPELLGSLQAVSALLTGKRSPSQFVSQKQEPLGSSLNQLFTNFGSENQRRQNQEGYYEAMRTVLSQTKEGARVLRCFETLDPGVSGTLVEFAEGEDVAPSATFETVYDETSQSYLKVITIGSGDSPALTLSFLAHEMQHACNTPEFIALDREERELFSRFDRLAETPGVTQEELDQMGNTMVAHFTERNIRYAIDELRAYEFSPKIFSELAPYHPEFFCNQYYVSSLFGRQILGTGQYMSSVETSVADGSFIFSLIDTYIRSAGYDAAAFYEIDGNTGDIQRDSQGRPIFRSEVRAAIAKEGFRVP